MDVSVPSVYSAVSVRSCPGELILVDLGDVARERGEDREGTGVPFAESAVVVEDELASLGEIEIATEESREGGRAEGIGEASEDLSFIGDG